MRASKNFCASACFSAWALAACAKGRDIGSGALDARASAPASTSAPASASEVVPSGSAGSLPPPDPYLSAAPTRATSVGHTSYVLKLEMQGGLVAAYKPCSHLPRGDRRYKSEIAAYRLAMALGLENVPRAVPRAFAAAEVEAAFSTAQGASDFSRKVRKDADGQVRGALIPWIDRYEVLPLEEPASRARWERWLTGERTPPPEPDRNDARAISTMVAFDYLTANWDRWSGGNVARDGGTGKVLFVDNDGAFYDPPPAEALARQLGLLRRVVRFSRGFVSRLRGLGDLGLGDAIGEESPGVPLLAARALAGVASRRQVVVELIDERLRKAGEAATLPFD